MLSIHGIIDILKQKESLSDSGNQLLQMIISSIDRLDDSIVEILDYSRNARFDVEHTELDLESILQQITSDLQHLAPVSFNINFETSSLVKSDKFRLITILKTPSVMLLNIESPINQIAL